MAERRTGSTPPVVLSGLWKPNNRNYLNTKETTMKNKLASLPRLAACLALTCAMSVSLRAATITVTNTADNGPGTLRNALAAADIYDIIDLSGVSGMITLTNGELSVVTGVTILGPGPAMLTVSGNAASRVFSVNFTGTNVLISGLTIANGRVEGSGGGIYCASTSVVVSNCVLAGNSVQGGFGGGVGGAAAGGILVNCIITGNSASYQGGGASGSTLNNCILTGNSADYDGGGASGSTLNNCFLTGNMVQQGGGGAIYCTLNNCLLTGNSADIGGGTFGGSLYNCTLAGNSASWSCGGAYSGTLRNCIIYYNTSQGQPNYSSSYSASLSYCCTTPNPGGTGNFATAPLFWDTNGWSNLRLQPGSPCIDAGNNAYAPGPTDLDGNPRIYGVAVDVGAYEFQTPMHYVSPASANPVPPYYSWATAATNIQQAIDAAWAGDEVVVTNGVYQTGVRDVYGMSNRVAATKAVTVRSVNGPAMTSIVGYGVPGTPHGPAAVRCVYLTDGAILSGFTLTNGATQNTGDLYTNQSGGGVWCEPSAVVSNCVLAGNSANWVGGGAIYGTLNNCTLRGNSTYMSGGGAALGTLNNCTLAGNSAINNGGGSYGGTLNNCTLTGNWGGNMGGGAAWATLTNCIVYYNTAPSGPNSYESTCSYCCTTPLPPDAGNLTAEPLFVATNGWGNLRLQAGSPCINAGYISASAGVTDLDNNPRISGGIVDIGAYEYQFDPFHLWLLQYGLPFDSASEAADPDHDGLNNWQEWVAGTNPTNDVSVLRILSASGTASGVAVSWSSVANRSYSLEWAANLGASPAFSLLRSNITGSAGTTAWTDTNGVGSMPRFYRVRVDN